MAKFSIPNRSWICRSYLQDQSSYLRLPIFNWISSIYFSRSSYLQLSVSYTRFSFLPSNTKNLTSQIFAQTIGIFTIPLSFVLLISMLSDFNLNYSWSWYIEDYFRGITRSSGLSRRSRCRAPSNVYLPRLILTQSSLYFYFGAVVFIFVLAASLSSFLFYRSLLCYFLL